MLLYLCLTFVVYLNLEEFSTKHPHSLRISWRRYCLNSRTVTHTPSFNMSTWYSKRDNSLLIKLLNSVMYDFMTGFTKTFFIKIEKKSMAMSRVYDTVNHEDRKRIDKETWFFFSFCQDESPLYLRSAVRNNCREPHT